MNDENEPLSDETPSDAPAPVELTTEAPEGPAEPQEQSDPVAAPGEEDEETRSQRRRRQRREREDRLTVENTVMAEEIGRLQARLASMQAPDYGSYENSDDYVADRAAHAAQKATLEGQIDAQTARHQAAAAEQQRLTTEAYSEAAAEAATRYPDFEVKAHGQHWSPSPVMVDLIRTSEKGPDVAYYLGSNPQEAAQIATLPPLQQAAALGRIEARISAPKPKPAAPPPITPLRSAQAPAEPSPDSMSYDDYKAWRLRKK